MTNTNKTSTELKTVRTSWTAWYKGEAGATFVRVECAGYAAIAVYTPSRPAYVCEVYTLSRSGMESFLGYEIAVCVHPGPMMRAINEARPIWATQANHAPV